MQSRTGLTIALGVVIGGTLIVLGACTPRIEVTPSDKPITINLNVKIDHEVRVKVDKELDHVLSDKSGLF
ncbi:MAG: YnbE family lipoprotein [Nitrospirae bacterium RBG_19FT_COMBO_58_9]|nr:MAG: YnbE family lipoprotein [Nitrospirae bacterium RBG_19FT_COMBO_58_9]